jgi:hypothetical protein
MGDVLYTKHQGLRKGLEAPAFLDCPLPELDYPAERSFWEGAHVNSTLKIQTPEAITLIEEIKAELKKRAEAKAKRMWLRKPKRLARR